MPVVRMTECAFEFDCVALHFCRRDKTWNLVAVEWRKRVFSCPARDDGREMVFR